MSWICEIWSTVCRRLSVPDLLPDVSWWWHLSHRRLSPHDTLNRISIYITSAFARLDGRCLAPSPSLARPMLLCCSHCRTVSANASQTQASQPAPVSKWPPAPIGQRSKPAQSRVAHRETKNAIFLAPTNDPRFFCPRAKLSMFAQVIGYIFFARVYKYALL